MRARLIAAIRLVALVAIEAAAIPLLRGGGEGAPASIDWGHLGHWLATADPEDAVTAVVRLGAMVLATWLLATTVLYLLALLTRLPGLVRGIEWATLPAVRKAVDAAVAASVLGGAVLGAHPAGAQVPAPAPIVVELSSTATSVAAHLYTPVAAGDVVATSSTIAPARTSTLAATTTSLPPTPVTTAPVSLAARTAETTSPAPAPGVVRADDAHVYTVVAGDNLWTISEAELSGQTGRGPDHLAEVEIRNYWVKVIGANRGRLRSGDVNLIYPGESILCPPAIG